MKIEDRINDILREKKKKAVYVAIALDKSGSMEPMKAEAISGFNEYIQTLKSADYKNTDVFVTLVTFNDKVNVVFTNKHIDLVEEITEAHYRPGGTTAMFDAIGHTIEVVQSNMDEKESALAIIISDGCENSSQDYKAEDIATKVKELTEVNKWKFVYIGANQDLSQVAKDTGISTTMSYDANSVRGMGAMYTSVSNTTLDYIEE